MFKITLFTLLLSLTSVFSLNNEGSGEDGSSKDFLLDSSNFDQVVNGSRFALVKFYAEWCGHCKAMAKDYERLHEIIARHAPNEVVIVKVKDNQLVKKNGVSGFPTIRWYNKGDNKMEEYRSGRDLASMLKFVKERAGLHHLNIPVERKYSVDVNLKSLEEATERKNAFVMFYAPCKPS